MGLASKPFRLLPTSLKGGLTVTQIKARNADGRRVIIIHEDCGDAAPAYDANDLLYRAYTSRFTIGDQVSYIQVDGFLADTSGDAQAFRMKVVHAALAALGYEFTDADITFVMPKKALPK